ncbi:MAG: PAS domain S-box protein [Stappiaceae bacterium]
MAPPQSSEFDASKWRARIRPIGGLCGMLLIAIVGTVTFSGWETSTRFTDMKDSWLAYSEEAERKGVWISDLRGQFGYGGMIHHFKNYVLRRDGAYLRRLEEKMALLNGIIDSYLASQPGKAERDALMKIRRTANLYAARIPEIKQGIVENKAVEQIDALVRVDDREAFAALAQLEQIWQTQRANTLSDVVTAISDGEVLTRNVSTTLVILLILALLIFGLMHALIGQSLKASDRLSLELKARKKAQEAAKKLTRAVEQSPTTIIISDVQGRIEYINKKFVELTGYSHDEVVGQTPRMLKSGHTDDDAYSQIWTTLKERREWRGIFKNRKKDGTHYWASTAILPLVDEEGRITNFIGIGEDVTERKLAREQIAKAQKMEAVGLLAGGVAHDFNNVLMAIMGNVQLARLCAEDAAGQCSEIEEIDEALGHIEIASKRAQGLVRQLLTFARRQPTKSRRVSIQDQVTEVLELIRASVPANVELRLEGDVGDAAIDADPTVLHQVVMNLCRNAAEALGGENGSIILRVQKRARWSDTVLKSLPPDAKGVVQLDVIDDGPGIPEDIVQRVFDPFYSTKPIGKGTGLGLSVVRNAMEDLNGAVELKTSPGEGTRFSLYFPEMEAAEQAQDVQQILSKGHERILLVDDEEDVLYTLRRMLTRLGYRVDAYSNPLHVLSAFATHPDRYDCLIADFVMPELCGPDLIDSVRKIRPELPAILCSAYHNQPALNVTGGEVLRLEKPASLYELSSSLRLVLNAAACEAAE